MKSSLNRSIPYNVPMLLATICKQRRLPADRNGRYVQDYVNRDDWDESNVEYDPGVYRCDLSKRDISKACTRSLVYCRLAP